MATWLVTGANRGIGLELARQLHARGDTVIATCRSSSPELDAVGCRVLEGIDVGSDGVGEALDAALEPDETIDVVVNNAGIGGWDSLERLDLDLARRQYDVNTLGPLRVTLALLPRLAARRPDRLRLEQGRLDRRPSLGRQLRLPHVEVGAQHGRREPRGRARSAWDPRRRPPSGLRPHRDDRAAAAMSTRPRPRPA